MNKDERTNKLIDLYNSKKSIKLCVDFFNCDENIIISALSKLFLILQCRDCKKFKDREEFNNNKRFKSGKYYYCRKCKSEHDKKYALQNKLKISKYQKEYGTSHKEEKRKYDKEYKSRQCVKIKELERGKERREDYRYRISKNISSGIRRSLNKQNSSWKDLVNFTFDDLEIHLKEIIKKIPNANWDDFIEAKLELDHIRPINSFNFESVNDEEFKKCWNLNNLQLLWAKDNNAKSDKYDETEENNSFNLKYVNYEQIIKNINVM